MQSSCPGERLKNFRLRRHTDFSAEKDVISSLPDELIGRILDSLPTKDGAALSFTSKRMHRLFPWLTTLDLDDSPIRYCSTRPRLIERFPTFRTFVDSVLKASLSPQLNSFQLRLGGNWTRRTTKCIGTDLCKQACYPHMRPSQLNTWICFPLTRQGIREIDLCIHVRNHCMVPGALFTCETLEVLKLDVSLDFAQVCALPNFRLPNLKVLHLVAILIPEDDLISKLLSSCPSLEEFIALDLLKHGVSITVSSPSLQRLSLLFGGLNGGRRRNVVRIDTPNLQYLLFFDGLAEVYSISSMNALVEANFDLHGAQPSFQSMLSLVKGASNVELLTLSSVFVEALDLDILNVSLPVFRNLKRLELSQPSSNGYRWQTLLLGFLNHSPSLETLNFPRGLSCGVGCSRKKDELDRQVFETTQEIPSCCASSLKRILIV